MTHHEDKKKKTTDSDPPEKPEYGTIEDIDFFGEDDDYEKTTQPARAPDD